MRLIRQTIAMSIISIIALGSTCAPPAAPPLITPVAELEPNNTISTAQSLSISNNEILNLTGALDPDEDIDLFSIGTLNAGDRVAIAAQNGTDLSLSVAAFEVQSDQLIATLFAAAQFQLNASQNMINQV